MFALDYTASWELSSSVNTVTILTDLLKAEPHTPTSEPVKYERKDGQWYAHNGVDIQDTQQRKG